MIPPGKTTLARMQIAAHNEAQRIEISQDGAVALGWRGEPLPDQVKLRDDFAGIVRMIDAIMSDKALEDRIHKRMAEQAGNMVELAPVADGDVSINMEEADAE